MTGRFSIADRRVLLMALCVAVGFVAPSGCLAQAPQSDQEFQKEREEMVRKHITSGIFGRRAIRDKAVIRAMEAVPRHKFVPEPYKTHAYKDGPLPIGKGQTISQPYIVASMTEALEVGPDDVVLEVGTGSGYQAAVLAEIVKDVYSIEIVRELGERAAKVLKKLGYTNIHTRIGDGYRGWPEHAPFDAIIVTAAPDHVPQPLVDQLKVGGRMVIPVGEVNNVQLLILLEKKADGTVERTELEPVRFVPLTGESQRR